MSVVILGAYIFSQTKIFKDISLSKLTLLDKILMIVFFVTISILSTYMGIRITSNSMATTRTIGIIAAGYLGGPLVGISTGLIVGIHRYFFGGFTALACGLSAFAAGIIGSVVKFNYKKNNRYILKSFVIGFTAESVNMICVLSISKPYSSAVIFVKSTAVPLVVINSLGLAIFIHIISKSLELHNLNKLGQEVILAELRALRAQIHPHFLFNALSTISYFCRANPSKARELIIDLSNYFRKTLKQGEDMVPLNEELDLIISYMNIEKARFGDKIKLFIDIPNDLYQVKVPNFIIQPLVENSIKHGLSCTPDGGTVSIIAKPNKKYIIFTISDTGIGMENGLCENTLNENTGIGLKNVNNRLKYMYGKESSLMIRSKKDIGTEISFRIPKEVS
jgi:LytS/YehU family sensor histidine kinase